MIGTERDSNRLIDTVAALQGICGRITAAGRVAVDTEFFWERTFYPELGIVQLGIDQNNAWLLDIPALEGRLEPLGELLSNPKIEKIIHDAKQDLTILRIATGSYPKNIFDTRLAAGFIGPSASLSLLDTCREFTGQILSKSETRSNWLQRPLSAKQYQYALEDVLFLPAVRNEISAKAETLGRQGWLLEEMKIYDNPEMYDDPPVNEVYSKVKGCSRLTRNELAILRNLAAWREKEARRRNRPRRHIVPDQALIELATRQPTQIEDLQANCGLSPRAAQRYGKQLLEAIREGLCLDQIDYPPSRQRVRSQKSAAKSRKILDFIETLCKEMDLDPSLLANRKEIENITQSDNPKLSDIPLIQGWRYKYAGKKILSMLEF